MIHLSTFTNPEAISLLLAHHPIEVCFIALVLGLLLSFTPCVLPMIPILSGMLLGQKKLSQSRAFGLSLAYVLSTATTLAMAGLLASRLGYSLQAIMQNPIALILMGLVLIALSFSLFGLYNLQLPSYFRHKLHHLSNKQARGTYLGVILLGLFSSLIVSPCASAPLAGILIYLSTVGNFWIGGIALWSLGLGMGIPVLLVSLLGSQWLLKNHRLMHGIKIFFGILLILTAGLLWSRLLPETKASTPHKFITVHTTSELNTALKNAQNNHQKALVFFSAKWCLSCQELETTTLKNPAVQKALASFVKIRADVTQNNQQTAKMQYHFGVSGPPTLLFIDAHGNVCTEKTLVGYIPAKSLLKAIYTDVTLK